MSGSAHAARGLSAAFVSTFFELVGFFMLMPLLLLTLSAHGIGAAAVGAFAALDWAGIFLVTPFAARVADALGPRTTFWISGAVPLIAAIGFVVTDVIAVWCVLFFVAGLASGLRWIVAEAMVAELAPPHRRGRIVGLFQTMIGVTFVVGPALLGATGTTGKLPFLVTAALLGAGVTCSLFLPSLPRATRADAMLLGFAGIRRAITDAPAVIAAGFVGGVFEAGISGLLPVYGLAIGFNAATSALLVSVSGLGSALMMLPAGELADRLDRHAVSAASAGAILAGACLLPFVAAFAPLAWIIAFVWGGAGGALYTLAMVDIGTRLKGPALVNGTAVLVMAYTLGGVVTPAVGGLALQHAPGLGFSSLFIGIAATGLALILIAFRRERARIDARC